MLRAVHSRRHTVDLRERGSLGIRLVKFVNLMAAAWFGTVYAQTVLYYIYSTVSQYRFLAYAIIRYLYFYHCNHYYSTDYSTVVLSSPR
jgi:hypothetical protein